MPAGRRRTGSHGSKVPVRVVSYRPAAKPEPASKHPPVASPRPTVRQSRPRAPLHIPAPSAVVTAECLAITLPVPPSINHQYSTVQGRRVLSSAGRTYKQHVGQQLWLALSQSPHKQTLTHRLRSEPLALSIRFYFTSPLRRDVDGGLKIAQDALCEGIGLNDNRIVETHLYKDVDRGNPRITVSLSIASDSPSTD
jgi:crossover junction endodeoxyribonuclease RusA